MSHLELGTLFDYWAALLPADEEQSVEEHAFACDACSSRLETTGELARAIPRAIAGRGGMNLCVTRELVERLEEGGLVLRHYRARFGDAVQCTVGRDDDMLVTWIEADFREVERVSVCLVVDGERALEVEDAPIDRETNELIFTLSGDMLRTVPTQTMFMRVYAIEGEEDRLLGEMRFDHTGFSA